MTQGTSEPEPEPEHTTSEPEPEPESTTPSMVDPRCQDCTGESACIWSDGQCYPRIGKDVCEGMSGAVWCGASEPEPEPETTTMTPSVADPRCKSCMGDYACIWTDGVCYPRVAQSACEGTSGAVWCGASWAASAMQVPSGGPQGMRKASVHGHSFLAPALIQAGAALERVAAAHEAAAEL